MANSFMEALGMVETKGLAALIEAVSEAATTYENALAITLRKWGLNVEQQLPIDVYFEGERVGEYFADVLVVELVIVEIKAAEALCEAHEAQLLNYLKATNIEVGLLLNFGPKATFKRKLFTNDKKRANG